MYSIFSIVKVLGHVSLTGRTDSLKHMSEVRIAELLCTRIFKERDGP
jgi:hypothetical protein